MLAASLHPNVVPIRFVLMMSSISEILVLTRRLFCATPAAFTKISTCFCRFRGSLVRGSFFFFLFSLVLPLPLIL